MHIPAVAITGFQIPTPSRPFHKGPEGIRSERSTFPLTGDEECKECFGLIFRGGVWSYRRLGLALLAALTVTGCFRERKIAPSVTGRRFFT